MITRALTGRIMAELNDGKAVIILGPRQVGKTTLLKDLFGNDSGTLFLSGTGCPPAVSEHHIYPSESRHRRQADLDYRRGPADRGHRTETKTDN